MICSTLAATGLPKLKLMLTQDATFVKTQLNVAMIREELFRNRSDKNIGRVNTKSETGPLNATNTKGQDAEKTQVNNDIVFNEMNPNI